MRKKVGFVGAALIAIVACDAAQQAGEEGLRGSGDAAADAGEWLADAGRVLIDAGEGLVDASDGLHDAGAALRDASAVVGNDAEAQEPPVAAETYTVECNSVYQWKLTGAATSTLNRWVYAELDVPTDGITGVDVVRCGRLQQEPAPCPDGFTCEGQVPQPHDCDTGFAVEIGDNTIRTLCAYGSQSGSGEFAWTYKWSSVRFTIRR